MAKISTYATTAPALGDMLIGTDVNDINSTKNFTIGSLLSLPGSTTYVPYTGATNDVFLLGYGFYANEFVVYGGTSSQFLKADGSIDSTAYLPVSTAASTYVPYTGATGNVDLGIHRLTVKGLTLTSDDVEMIGLTPPSAINDYFEIGNWGGGVSGFLVDFVNNRYYLGDRLNAVNGTYIKIDDANSRVEISKAIYTNASTGTAGQILTSQGAGLPATWSTFAFGSFYDINTQTTSGSSEEFMEFSLSQGANDVSIVNNGLGNPTQITVAQTGVYNIQFSAQLTKTGGTAADINIYFKKNGAAIGLSNKIVTLANDNQYVVASWNFFVQLNAGQYAEIAWYTTNSNVQLLSIPVAVPPVATVPSVILTVNRIS